jgi:hypothetical protein
MQLSAVKRSGHGLSLSLASTLLLTLVLLGGCWNGGNTSVRLGDVSLGQQLIDLKRALDEGAMTAEEYEQTKQTLLKLNNLCENTEGE